MHKTFFGEVHWGGVQRLPSSHAPITLEELGRAHWFRFHSMIWTPEELEAWERDIPSFGCDCGPHYAKLKEANPVRFGDMDRWKWEIHNSVNLKLGKPLFHWDELYKPILGLVAVTSLAPHRKERQLVCLNSWRRFGLDIMAVNSQAEIDSMRDDYPIAKWIAAEFEKTPKINSLIDVSAMEDTAILVINSDIEIYGQQSRLTDLVANRQSAIGIRHNYDFRPGYAIIEPWGLDAFLIYPEQIPRLSKVDFAIGKPMWDYWLADELEKLGKCDWIGEPYFFHRSHPIAWTQEESTKAHEAYANRFQPVDWSKWRRSKPFSN